MRVHTRSAIIEVVWIIAFMVFGSLSGCSGDSEVGNPSTNSVSLFESDTELEGYIKEQLASNIVPYKVEDIAPQAGAQEGDTHGGAYSRTTIQESGVDESDTVKSDGTNLYIARSDEVVIVKAAPASEESIVARIHLGGTVGSLYLYNHLLVIFTIPVGSSWIEPRQEVMIGIPYWIPSQAKTGVVIYDITTPSAPIKLKELEIEGSLVSSRLVSGKLHVVQQFLPALPPIDTTYDGSPDGMKQAVESNTHALDSLTLTDLVPSYTVTDGQGQKSAEAPLVSYRNFYRPGTPEGGSIVTITSLDLDDEELPFDSIGFVGDTHTVYASTSALYLIANTCTGMDEPYTYRSQTMIHKFNLEDLSNISSGSVPGWIVNQFSLGEYADVLHIATTDNTDNFEGFTNSVFCLSQNGSALTITGRIDDITPGERIYSARFIGDRGYLVTFMQVDPLITLDLSDPEHPAMIGELVLPGYSCYIHPVDDDYLVTLGMETTAQGDLVLNGGVQLSLFDVSDPTLPELLDRVTIGVRGTYSEALWNHKAFTFFADENFIAFPVDLHEDSGGREDPWTTGILSFSGLYVYRLNAGVGFDYLGRISTATDEYPIYGYWTRGIFMDDTVHVVNQNEVNSANVSDIEHTIHTLVLTE